MTAPTILPRTSRLALVPLWILLAAMLTNLATLHHPRFQHLPDAVDSQLAILERRPFIFENTPVDYPSWRSRLLSPILIQGIANAGGLTFSQAYLLFRFLSAFAALVAFASVARRLLGDDPAIGALSAVLLTVTLIPTFLHIYDIPSDFPDVAFFALLLGFTLEKRRLAFAGTLMLALLNRESALFALPMWFVMHGAIDDHVRLARESAFVGLLGLAGLGLTLGLRARFALERQLSPDGTTLTQPVTDLAFSLQQITDFLARPLWSNSLFFLAGYLTIFILVIWQGWLHLASSHRRLAGLTLGVFAASVPFANLPELRVYMPSLVTGTFLMLTSLVQRLRQSAPPALPVP